MSKAKKQAEKLLRAIEFESAPLSTKKGRILGNDNCPNKVNSKKRRHRGWVTGRLAGNKGKYSEMFEEANEPQLFYDSWADARDGLRYDPDETHIRDENMYHQQQCKNCRPTCHLWNTCQYKDNPNPLKRMNQKLLRQIKIRKAKQEKAKLKS